MAEADAGLAGPVEGLDDPAGDRARLRDGVSTAWKRLPRSSGRPAPSVHTPRKCEQSPLPPPPDDEADPVVHALVEGEAVRAADEPDATGAVERQELRLALPEPSLCVRRKPAVQVRGHVHEDDTVRLLRRLQRAAPSAVGSGQAPESPATTKLNG